MMYIYFIMFGVTNVNKHVNFRFYRDVLLRLPVHRSARLLTCLPTRLNPMKYSDLVPTTYMPTHLPTSPSIHSPSDILAARQQVV